MDQSEIQRVVTALKKQVASLNIPWLDAMTAFDRDPFRVLVSCLLSLRTQDKTTEAASKRLFALASTPKKMATLDPEKIEKAIYPVGFYRVKSQRISNLSKTLIQNYGGAVPDSIEELLKLKGVGRKTANLVVTLGFDRDGICVDTHVHRITNRWGYVKTKTPHQTEFALRGKLPLRYWKEINGLLVAFGQNICTPLSPKCSICSLERFCAKKGVGKHR